MIPSSLGGIERLMGLLSIEHAETPPQIAAVRELMMEYAAALGFDLCFQDFDEELRSLPGKYASPAGRLLLATWDGHPAGMVAMRALEEEGACEMKRLFVRPAFRGESLGRKLAERVIAEATQVGYARMKLDTVQGIMDSAIRLYRELGFREIPAYYATPMRETLFMELDLLRR